MGKNTNKEVILNKWNRKEDSEIKINKSAASFDHLSKRQLLLWRMWPLLMFSLVKEVDDKCTMMQHFSTDSYQAAET